MVDKDLVMYEDFDTVLEIVKSGAIVEAVEAQIGALR